MRLALIALILTGCATTKVYRNGQKILETQMDASGFEFRDGDTHLVVARMNHSTPTRAGGSVVGTAGTAATGVTAAIFAGITP